MWIWRDVNLICFSESQTEMKNILTKRNPPEEFRSDWRAVVEAVLSVADLYFIVDLPMITALQELRSAEELKHRKEAEAAYHLSSVQSTPEKPRASSTFASDPLLHTPATPSGMWYVCCVLSYTITLHNLKTFCQCCLKGIKSIVLTPQSLGPSTTTSPSKPAAAAATSPSSADKDKEKLHEWEAKMEQERQEAERRYSVSCVLYIILV